MSEAMSLRSARPRLEVHGILPRDTAVAGAKPLRLPPQSPNLNAFAERWVRSVKGKCLRELILFGEGSLNRALSKFPEHYHSERPHQGKGNVLLFPTRDQPLVDGAVRCNATLGGLLRYCSRTA